MTRYLAILLLMLVAGEACAQGIMLVRVPQSAHDLTRDPTTKLSTSDSGDGNSTVVNAEIKKLGTSIQLPAFAPAGRYLLTSGVTFGCRASGVPISGGQFLGAGGTTPAYQENEFTNFAGAVTRFTYAGGFPASTDLFTFVGRQWYFGLFELHGIRLVTSTDRTNRDTGFTKCRSGLTVSKTTNNFSNGHLHGALALMGFEKGINVIATPIHNHGDTLLWDYLDFDTCDVGYYCANQQSVGHYIDFVICNAYVDTLFRFDLGGDLYVRVCQMLGPNTTLLDINGGSYNDGVFCIEGVKIDNNADNPVLLTIDAARVAPVSVIIRGTVGDGVDYTEADLVQGEDENDKIFIQFTGEPTRAAAFNAQSTVAAPPF